LVGDTYACTEIVSYEANEPGATAKLKHVRTLESGTTLSDVARQDLQTTHIVRKIGRDNRKKKV
jgi:hypothetical protein